MAVRAQMTWLVTGGAGYIGAHVVRAFLAEGMKVVVIDDLSSGHAEFVPDGVPFVRGTILDAELLRRTFAEHDAADVVLRKGASQQLRVEDGAAYEGHSVWNELRVAAGEVVDDDDLHALGQECPNYMGADVSGSPGDQPSHLCPHCHRGNPALPPLQLNVRASGAPGRGCVHGFPDGRSRRGRARRRWPAHPRERVRPRSAGKWSWQKIYALRFTAASGRIAVDRHIPANLVKESRNAQKNRLRHPARDVPIRVRGHLRDLRHRPERARRPRLRLPRHRRATGPDPHEARIRNPGARGPRRRR